jgi:succinoglycan biosynthesis transport protein ExoP
VKSMKHTNDANLVVSEPKTLPMVYYQDYRSETGLTPHLRDNWNILKKRKFWVLAVFLGVVVIVGLVTFLMTPIYRSSTILQIVQDNNSAVLGERDPLAMMNGQDTQARFYETQYLLLNSRSLLYRIIDILNLTEHAAYKPLKEKGQNKSPQWIKDAIAESLYKNLGIQPLKRSYLVEISFKSPDKALSQEVPNAIYQEYVKFAMVTRHQSYKLITEWLGTELHKFATKVETSERELYAQGKKKDFLSLESKEENVIVRKYVELHDLLTKAQAERTQKESQYRQIQKKGVDAPPIVNNLLIQKLREATIAQEAKVSSINKIYDQNYPQLQAEEAKLRDQRMRLNNEVQRMRASIEADYEAAVRTENLLREAVASQKGNVVNLQDDLVQHHILKRDMLTNEQLYQALLARMKEASVASTMVTSNVAVIAPAEFPLKPYLPKKTLFLSLAAVVGLLGGISMAFLMEYLDDSVKTTEELERGCHIPSLGVVPFLSQNGQPALEAGTSEKPELATFSQPKSMLGEALFHVRTSVLLSSPGGPPGTIIVTSANPSEGKTTISVNLASALALNGKKVVIIDADMRKPRIHTIFQHPGYPGLSNFLTGGASLTETLQPTDVPDLFIIPAGTVPPNPAQLVTSEAFMGLLQELKKDFHHVIVDTPPLIGFADALAISSLADGVLLVVKHHSTSREAIRLGVQLLTQVRAPILGAILNMAQRDKLGYGGYYDYYKYYSHYHKKYSEVKDIGLKE